MQYTDLLTVTKGIADRARRIKIADDYHSDAGDNVFISRRTFDPNGDYPAISVLPAPAKPERVEISGGVYLVTGDFDVVGVIKTPSDDLAENPTALRTDMVRALMQDGDDLACLLNDLEYTGSDEPFAAEDETDAQVIVTLRASWYEKYGA